MPIKQVIIVRKDLRNRLGEKPRTGKIGAQIAHASLKALLDKGKFDNGSDHVMTLLLNDDTKAWINGNYKKIVLGCDSEDELLAIYETISEKLPHIPKALILDQGLTEFTQPTYTTLAIGPAKSIEIDPYTSYLKLL